MIETHTPNFFSSAYDIFSSREPAHAPERASVNKQVLKKFINRPGII